jgi:uncharacterized membrane protein YccC
VKYEQCGRILVAVLLMSFWKIPVFGEPLTTPLMNSEESGTRQYSEYEADCLAKLDLLIEDLTGAAHEAIEQAAAEAAKAATLASLDREMAALSEAQRLHSENSRLRQSRVKTAVVTGVVCFFGGMVTGSVVILQGVR